MSFVNHDPRILAPDRYFGMVDVAAGLFAVWVAMLAFDALPSTRSFLWLGWALLLLVLFFRRGQDEFWLGCWHKATAAALFALLAVPVVWGVADLFDDVAGGPRIDVGDAPVDGVLLVIFASFFGAFYWARFRGRAG